MNNQSWADRVELEQPGFFKKLSLLQSPKLLWIGCSDSRVPASEIVDLLPGEVFVHRNIANQVIHSDMNCLSVLQYAVQELKVENIVVCGHYGCGGVNAAMDDKKSGLLDNWLTNIRDIRYNYKEEFLKLADDPEAQMNLLCELNVKQQVNNGCVTSIVQDAWQRGQNVKVHGWIYRLKDGKIKNLEVTKSSQEDIESVYRLK
jgi:carbonic anhydrase